MKNRTQRLAILLVFVFGITLSLLAGEVALRLTYAWYANYNTEMWRYSKDIKVSVKDAGVGHEHRPNMKGKYYGVEIQTNSNGWRDREYAPETDKYRVMVLGASIVMGWGVEQENGFTKVLEKRLNEEKWTRKPGKSGVEVVNTGVGNYNTEMQVNSFFRRGRQYHPDQILLFSYVSDSAATHEPANSFLYPIMSTYLYALISDRWINFRAVHDPNLNFVKFYSTLNEPNNPGRIRMEAAIDRLAAYCRDNSIELQIVILPEMHQFKNYPFAEVHETMKGIGKKNGVRVIDLLPYLLEEEPMSLWVSVQDPHPNLKGHALIARSIYEAIFKTAAPPASAQRRDTPTRRNHVGSH